MACHDRRLGPHGIEQLGARQENDSGACGSKEPPGETGILRNIMLPALDRPERDRIDDDPRFEARLNPE